MADCFVTRIDNGKISYGFEGIEGITDKWVSNNVYDAISKQAEKVSKEYQLLVKLFEYAEGTDNTSHLPIKTPIMDDVEKHLKELT